MHKYIELFIEGIKSTSLIEFIAVIMGITSTYCSKKESILVFPTGIISTIIYIWISFKGKLFAEGGLNIYYTCMSINGWYMWTKNKDNIETKFNISYSNKKETIKSISFFLLLYISTFLILKNFTPSTVPYMDALAFATAFTAMFLMNRKKIENWYWWIATDTIAIPLYFSKGYVFTSVQYLVFLFICISGMIEWKKKYNLLATTME